MHLACVCSLGRRWSAQGRRPVLAFSDEASVSSRFPLSPAVFSMPREPRQCSQQRRARDAERHRTRRRMLADATDPVVVAHRDNARERHRDQQRLQRERMRTNHSAQISSPAVFPMPTGIAAANISGSTVHSLLSLLSSTLSSQRLVGLQNLMRDVRLLIIDDFRIRSEQ